MDLALERTRLLQRDAEWAAAASEGRDLELVLSFWTDDAVVLAPGLPAVVGKDALRQYVQGGMEIPDHLDIHRRHLLTGWKPRVPFQPK